MSDCPNPECPRVSGGRVESGRTYRIAPMSEQDVESLRRAIIAARNSLGARRALEEAGDIDDATPYVDEAVRRFNVRPPEAS